MAPKKKGRKTAAAPAAAPAVAYGPEDANELDKLPDDKAYESLGEDDAPPRDVLEEEDLLGLCRKTRTKRSRRSSRHNRQQQQQQRLHRKWHRTM